MSVWVTGGVSTRSLSSRTPKARQGLTLFSPQWYISAPTAAHPPGAPRAVTVPPLLEKRWSRPVNSWLPVILIVAATTLHASWNLLIFARLQE